MKIELIYADGTKFTQELLGEVERIQLTNSKIAETMQIKFAVPIRDMHCVWTPKSRTPEQKLHWKIDNICAAQSNFPYLCFMRKDQLNTCSIGSSNLIDDTQIIAQMNQASGCYNVTITIALSSSTPDFYLTIDRRAIKWTKVLSDWRDNLGITKP